MSSNSDKQICFNEQCVLSVHGECHQLPKLYWECLHKEDGSVELEEEHWWE